MTNEKDYQAFLDKVAEIQKKYDKKDEKKLKQGKYFNIFNIIGKSSDEVNIHSKFIATLLDPNGEHGCGDVFLKSFLEKMKISNLYDIKKAEVKTEYSIGNISSDGTEGGRLDILITCNKDKMPSAIIIENKIYAGDEKNQLLRYKKYAKKFKDPQIFYLTLDGRNPSKDSVGDNNTKRYWKNISYKKDIKEWLDDIEKQSLDNNSKTGIKQIINQYINLIDWLTGEDENSPQTEKIRQLLKAPANLPLAIDISNSVSEVKEIILKKFYKHIEQHKPTDCYIEPNDGIEVDGNYRRIYFDFTELPCYFTFEICMTSSYECKFGIVLKRKNEKKQWKEKIRNLQTSKNTHSWWMVWDYPSDDYAFWNAETFLKVNNEPGKLYRILRGRISSFKTKLKK